MSSTSPWAWLLFAALTLTCTPAAHSQVAPDTAFQVTNTDRHWLTYYHITNEFDSATVMVEYGEMLLKTATSKVRLKPKTRQYVNNWYHNADSAGFQAGIANLARWDTVTVPAASQLRFYRFNTVLAFTDKTELNPTGRVNFWRIHDRSVFVLEVRDYVTDTLICVADSVSIDTCTKATYSGYSGTNPTASYHSVALPSHAVGKKIYVVVKPYRYGPTPYGMALASTPAEIAQSLLWKSTTTAASKEEFEKLDSMRFARFLDHIDSYYRAYCYIPDYSGFGFSEQEFDTLIARYWVLDTTVNGRTYYRVRPCNSADSCTFGKQRAARTLDGRGLVDVGMTPRGVTIVTHRTDNNSLQLVVRSASTLYGVNVCVHQIDGRHLSMLNGITLPTGESSIEVPLGSAGVGLLLVRISNADGTVLTTETVLR